MTKTSFSPKARRQRRGTRLWVLCALCGAAFAQDQKTVQTPFGPAARRTGPVPAPARGRDLSLIAVEEKGGVLTFRRRTPFGESVWTRQRSELTAFEREAAAAEQARRGRDPRGAGQ